MAQLQFQVVLEDITLSKAQITAIEKDIGDAVARNLLKAKTKTTRGAVPTAVSSGLVFEIPREWVGRRILDLSTIADKVKFKNKGIEKMLNIQTR